MLYPILTSSRFLSDLSGIWSFKLDNGHGFEEKWFAKKLEKPLSMPVPSSYNDIHESLALRNHYGWVFYQRDLEIPSFIKNERVVLRMDSVTHHAKVYLNEYLICEHKGGFLPFEVEIQDLLNDGYNLLTIAVSNIIDYSTLPVGGKSDMMSSMIPSQTPEVKGKNNPNFDFFNYSGIHRPVKIYTTPKKYIKDVSITSSILNNDAKLNYTVDTSHAGKCSIEVYDELGNLVTKSKGKTGVIEIKNANLWEPLNPYLYNIKIKFEDDEYKLPFGIRTVRVRENKFYINNKAFYFKGYGKHEDTFPAGKGLNLPMNAKDISLLKWQGANSFRTSHYPYSEEMMRLCDREGIVVIDETPAVGINLQFGGGAAFGGDGLSTYDNEKGIQTQEHHKEVIRDMIDRDKNYACVVMWSLANEPDNVSPGGYEYFEPLYRLAKKLDPQKRPCTVASVQMTDNPKVDFSSRLSDVICLNRYYGWYFSGGDLETAEKALNSELAKWEKVGKPLIFTEYGADTISGLHDTVPTMYTEEYQIAYYKMNNKVFDSYPFIIGEHAWNFADFETGQSLLRVQGNKKGLFTRDRKPKMAAHYFKERWNSIPNFKYK